MELEAELQRLSTWSTLAYTCSETSMDVAQQGSVLSPKRTQLVSGNQVDAQLLETTTHMQTQRAGYLQRHHKGA